MWNLPFSILTIKPVEGPGAPVAGHNLVVLSGSGCDQADDGRKGQAQNKKESHRSVGNGTASEIVGGFKTK